MATRQQFKRQLKSLGGTTDSDRFDDHECIFAHAPDRKLWRASGTHSICQEVYYKDTQQRNYAFDSLLDDLQHGTIDGPCEDQDCEECYPEE